MATSAFKSTTKRTPIGKSPSTTSSSTSATDDSASSFSSSFHRRSRSLSQFSRPLPKAVVDDDFSDDSGAPPPPSMRRAKFVNTVRGTSELFPEITLDDLAISFFGSSDRRSRRSDGGDRSVLASHTRGRSVLRRGGDGHSGRTENYGANSRRNDAAERRGRSMSRHGIGGVGSGGGYSGGTGNSDGNSRRRRSVSVVPYKICDSEVLSLFLHYRALIICSFGFEFISLRIRDW